MTTEGAHEIRFHERIYRKVAVANAVEAYGDFARAEVRKEKPYWIVTLQPLDDEFAQVLPLEFINYVLAENVDAIRSTPS
jgi:hypothetical protein